LLALAFVSAGTLWLASTGPANAEDPTLAIDVGTDGNSASAIGETEDCISVTRGASFDTDIVIQNVTDLLAWELTLDYDGSVLTVTGQDVKMFQGANPGSSPVDISARLPDDSGAHTLSAFESSDPLTPDTGTGVLARVTFEATEEGETELRFGSRDIDGDGTLDRGTLLKDVNAEEIGDTTGDGFFDGESSEAIVVVGDDCPEGYTAYTVVAEDDDSSSSSWIYIAAGVAAFLGVLAVVVLFLRSRRGGSASP
jgi:hypothetical protein